jgi:hypothetical protein
MKRYALLMALAVAAIGCSDEVTRTTTTYRESSVAPAGSVLAPTIDDDLDETTTTRTKRVERTYEVD